MYWYYGLKLETNEMHYLVSGKKKVYDFAIKKKINPSCSHYTFEKDEEKKSLIQWRDGWDIWFCWKCTFDNLAFTRF